MYCTGSGSRCKLCKLHHDTSRACQNSIWMHNAQNNTLGFDHTWSQQLFYPFSLFYDIYAQGSKSQLILKKVTPVIEDVKHLKEVTLCGLEIHFWNPCPSMHFPNVKATHEVSTISDIVQNSKEEITYRTHKPHTCLHEPVFLTIPIDNNIPDPLHLYLRFTNQLIKRIFFKKLWKKQNEREIIKAYR